MMIKDKFYGRISADDVWSIFFERKREVLGDSPQFAINDPTASWRAADSREYQKTLNVSNPRGPYRDRTYTILALKLDITENRYDLCVSIIEEGLEGHGAFGLGDLKSKTIYMKKYDVETHLYGSALYEDLGSLIKDWQSYVVLESVSCLL